MSPASGKAPLRGIGPEDVDAAGELAPDVQDQNQAHELIKHVASSHPVELMTIQQLEEDAGRSKALVDSEVRDAAVDLVGDEERKGGLVQVLSARVKGYGRPVDQLWVVVLYETPSGRNARCAIPYEPLTASQIAYDSGVAEGRITEGKASDASDTSHFEAQIQRQEATIKRLEAEARAKKAEDADDTPPAPDEPPAPDTPEEVVLPDGVEAGDPGYPIGDDGELLVLPDSVRQELIEAHQAAVDAEDAAAAAGQADEQPERPEVDLDAVELPTGNADALIAGMAFYSDDVVAALAKRDERKTVREAAEETMKSRAAAADEG